MQTKQELQERVKTLRQEQNRLEKIHDEMQKAFSEKRITWEELKPSFIAFHRTSVLLAESELDLDRAWR